MFATPITIEQLISSHLPGYSIHKIDGADVILFSANDIIFNQHNISAFWRECNYYHLHPVAKTFLGRIRMIKFN
jgi:hypothetical protein